MRLTCPTFSGLGWVAKHVVDRLGSTLLLLLLSPLLLVLALGVRIVDPVVQAAAFQRVVDLARAIARDDDDRRRIGEAPIHPRRRQ